jgi:SagB-type dehydrogenase family enzyme
MNTLTKLALGLMGQLRAQAPLGSSTPTLELIAARTSGGKPLMDALRRRESRREFSPRPLPAQTLADLLWAAAGINRMKLGGRTAPSAMNAQEVLLYVALPEGLYLYDPAEHLLRQAVASDVRRVTGYQDFVDTAPLDLIYVADHARMKLVPADRREAYAFAAAGAMAQNVYLFCASAGLATVIRGWFDARALKQAMGLGPDQQILLAQTVGRPARARAAAGA